MLRFLITLESLVNDRVDANKDRGATAVEYGLMVALIAVAIIVSVTLLGTELAGLFGRVAARLTPIG